MTDRTNGQRRPITRNADREAQFIADLATWHDQARDAMAAGQWHALNAIAEQLNAFSTELSLAIAEGFNSRQVEDQLTYLIDFFRKALAQAAAADNVLLHKEEDLQRERQRIVNEAAAGHKNLRSD